MKPNKTRIKLWIKALRSGKFKQTRRQLAKGCRRCCLGVLCDVFKQVTGRGQWQGNYFEGCSHIPPQTVAGWFGLPGKDPQLTDSDSTADCNDTLKYSFAKIADLIEAKFITPNRKAK